MKQLSSRLLSVSLALIMLCTMVTPALAVNEVAPTRITLDKTAATVYLHGGTPIPVRLTAIVQPSDFNGTVEWSVPAESKLLVRQTDSTGATISAAADTRAGASGVVTVTAKTTSKTLTATCTVSVATDSIKSKSFGPFTVEVGRESSGQPDVVWLSGATDNAATSYYVDDPSIAEVSSQGMLTGVAKGSTTIHATFGGESLSAKVNVVGMEGISLNRNSLNMSVGDEPVALSATIRPEGLDYKPVFTTSNASVASVSADGKVTALRSGAATITARVTDSSGAEYTDTCTVSVAAVTGDITENASVGTDLSLKDAYTAIADRYSKSGGSGNPTIAFNSVGNSAVGTLYTTSAKTAAVDSTYYGSLSLLENMVFAPASTGRYIATYTISNSGQTAILTGTITIEVKGATKNIHIGIGSASEYQFSETASGSSTGAEIISAALGTYGSLRFGSVISGSSAGTLYTDSSSGSAVVRSGTTVNRGNVPQLYYVINRDASYQIEYSAYSGTNASGALLSTGTLTLGTGSDSLSITINPDGMEPYRFGSSTRGGAGSADSQLRSAINANVSSSTWKYIKFDSAPSANTCDGTLYTDSTRSYAVNANTYVAASDIDDLYFVPTQSGVYEIGYSVCGEDLNAAPLVSGRLRIVVSSLSSDTAALYYTLTPRDTLEFQDSDFEAWYVDQRSSGYHLEYVQFNSVVRSFGTLYHSNSRLTTGGSYSYYTADYYNAKTTNARRLSDVSYVAPSTTGYQEITFTCYGRSGSNGSVRSNSGTLRIFVTSGSVPDISYVFGGSASALLLQKDDFEGVYRSAMAVNTASPAFYIQLLELPDAGTLYSNYNDSTGRGTTLTSSTVSLYPFYVNGSSALDSVEDLAYVPSSRGIGTYSIRYAAFSRDGNALYVGTVTFRYSAEVSTVNVTDGYTFRAEDVCGNISASGVRYVIFDQPLLGKLYLNYANGRGTALPANTKLYVSSASNGSYPVSALTYVPRSDMEGEISQGFTVYTASRSYSDKLTLKIDKKTASARFKDVTPTTGGTWAASAIDFAAKWGLVNGMDTGIFAPGNTMRRCDLVLILYRNAGMPTVYGTLPYTDVPANAYYRDSALWAANNGILAGVVTGTTYNPDAAVTRQEFARVLYNYTAAMGGSLTGSASLSGYSDAGQIAAYARDAMAWAVSKGYINGTSPTTLSPGDKANRAQIATLLHRYLTL